jgi:hypothetical protein
MVDYTELQIEIGLYILQLASSLYGRKINDFWLINIGRRICEYRFLDYHDLSYSDVMQHLQIVESELALRDIRATKQTKDSELRVPAAGPLFANTWAANYETADDLEE